MVTEVNLDQNTELKLWCQLVAEDYLLNCDEPTGDQRKNQRINFFLPVKIKHDNLITGAKLINLSMNGFSFSCDTKTAKIRKDSNDLEVSLDPTYRNHKLNNIAFRIISILSEITGGYRYCCELTENSVEYLNFLNDIEESQNLKSNYPSEFLNELNTNIA